MNMIGSVLKHGWNIFTSNKDPTKKEQSYGPASYYRPDRFRLRIQSEKSILASIFNRIAVDVSSVSIRHVRLNENEQFVENVKSDLNNCLSIEANVDQNSIDFIRDLVLSMLEEGVVAAVPTDTATSTDPLISDAYKIRAIRVGRITQWYPKSVTVDLYNEETGLHEEVTLPKKMVAIIENPFYSIMNEPNSTLKRLKSKLSLLDIADQKVCSNKLDMIVQLPFTIRGDMQKTRAEDRRKSIEVQLASSDYGIAYIDSTEKVTQLNRPVENNLFSQVEHLEKTLYNQLGITQSVFDGTADEKAMLNYNNRTIKPILNTIVLEFKRKFLTKTARTQGQSIEYFTDPFSLVTVTELANSVDVFSRNEILSSNEIRGLIGLKPSTNPRADELINKNMPVQDEGSYENPNPNKDT